MTMTDTSTDPFQSGDASLPGIKFATIGDKATGQIIAIRQAPDIDLDGNRRTWANGEERSVWVFDLDTTGSGEADSSLWVRGNIFTALRDALKEAGIATVGAMISLTHHAVGDPPKKGYNPPKLFTAKVKAGPPIRPPADPFSAPADNDDF